MHSVPYGRTDLVFSLARRDRKTLEIGVCPTLAIEVVAPLNATLEDIKAKVRKRAAWISEQLRFFDQFQPFTVQETYVSGSAHLYLGRQYRLKIVPHIQSAVKLRAGQLIVQSHRPLSPEISREMVNEWYTVKARTKFHESLERCFSPFDLLGHEKPSIVIRKMTKRWGSHTTSGNILLNPRLIRAPKECIDYVVTHELCHLEHKDHSNAFWNLLEKTMPDWQDRKLRLERRLA